MQTWNSFPLPLTTRGLSELPDDRVHRLNKDSTATEPISSVIGGLQDGSQ